MRKKDKKNLKQAVKVILAILILIAGIGAAIYYGLWVMFIQAILTACAAFDAGTLTATLVGWTIIKCLLASAVSGLIISVCAGIAKLLCK